MSARWFELLLRLFPSSFRSRHGDAMREAFAHGCEDHGARGRLSLGGFLVRTTLDLTVSGVRERVAPRRGAGAVLRRMARGGGRAGSTSRGVFSLLDVKLGIRMLMRYPGLTLVSTFALAVGIPVGLAPAHFVDGIMAPLPLPEGDRIRSLRLWSPALGRADRMTYHDYRTWRSALSSFEDLGAFRETSYNVDPGDRAESAVRGAEMSASAFEITRVQPILGRTIQPADEQPGADAVVVLGYDLWQARFAADPAIVGRTVRLGSMPHTVVGVMPEEFLFPERQQAWTALRTASAEQPGEWMPVTIFGRLAEGVDDHRARSEFALVAERSTGPDRDHRLVPQVEPYAFTLLPGLNGDLKTTPEFIGFQTFALIVLLVACANVGMLVFARTATRAGELAVRTALGASRARIVAQVFTECLVLAVLASGAGLLLVGGVLDLMWRVLPARWATMLPYWIDWSVTGRTALRALALAGLSAAVAGAIPALRFTGRSVQSNIQRARARRTGLRFGGLSSVLIVLDVAVAVAAVGFAVATSELVREVGTSRDVVGIPAQEYLAAEVRLPPRVLAGASPEERSAGHVARMAETQQELVRRLEAEPEVRAVAVADYLPRMEHYPREVEAEGMTAPDGRKGISSRTARVDIDFFEALGQPIVQGRGFDVGDRSSDRSVVIVNTSFVEHVLGGQNPIGRRIRYHPWGDGEPGPWKEIVGVVGPLGMRVASPNDWGVYEPLAPGELSTVRLGIHVGDDPASIAPRLRAIAGEVDAEAIVDVIGPLDGVHEGDWYLLLAASVGGALLVGVLLALAASGIYALMSFAVAERTTEIGVRAALGAERVDLVRCVARRAVAQIGIGVLLGMPLALEFMNRSDGGAFDRAGTTLGVGVAVMVLVGLAACTGPTLRALRVQPSEALRAEG